MSLFEHSWSSKGSKISQDVSKSTLLSIFGAPGHPKTRVLASVFRWENLFSFVLAAISTQNRTKSVVKHEVSAFSKQVKPCILRVQTLFFLVLFSADSSKNTFFTQKVALKLELLVKSDENYYKKCAFRRYRTGNPS